MTENRKKMLSVKDAADALQLSEQRIKQLIYDQRLKAEKVGNQWIILESDLEAVKDRPTGRPAKDKDVKLS